MTNWSTLINFSILKLGYHGFRLLDFIKYAYTALHLFLHFITILKLNYIFFKCIGYVIQHSNCSSYTAIENKSWGSLSVNFSLFHFKQNISDFSVYLLTKVVSIKTKIKTIMLTFKFNSVISHCVIVVTRIFFPFKRIHHIISSQTTAPRLNIFKVCILGCILKMLLVISLNCMLLRSTSMFIFAVLNRFTGWHQFLAKYQMVPTLWTH